MKKISLIIILSNLINQSYAIDLETKIRNTDTNNFIVNPTSSMQKKNLIFGSNIFITKDPLVLRNLYTGNHESLISDVKTINLYTSYKILDNVQFGLMLDVQNIKSNIENKTFIGNYYFESKIGLNKIALIPYYILPNKNKIKIKNQNKEESIIVGKEKGSYGLKISYDIPYFNENKLSTLFGIQKAILLDQYKNYDQTNFYFTGVSSNLKLSTETNWKNELILSFFKNNTSMEYLSYFNYSGNNYLLNIGAGTGNFQDEGSNKYKVFANITFDFDQKTNERSFPVNKINKMPVIKRNNQEKIEDLNEVDEIEENKIKIIKPQSLIISKKTRQIASVDEKGVYKKLPNGDKVRVFKNKITQMPSEIGVKYLTEAEYNKILKNEKNNKKDHRKIGKGIVIKEKIEAQPISEEKPLIEISENLVKPNEQDSIIKKEELKIIDSDPVNLLIDEVVNDKKISNNIEDKKYDTNYSNLIMDLSLDKEAKKELDLINKKDNYVEKTEKISKEEENKLLEELIVKKIEQRKIQEEELKKKKIIDETIAIEEEIKQKPILTEKVNRSQVKTILLNEKESKPISVLSKKTKKEELVISVPKIIKEEVIENEVKQAIQIIDKNQTLEHKIEEKLGIDQDSTIEVNHLLNENNEIEEANNPAY